MLEGHARSWARRRNADRRDGTQLLLDQEGVSQEAIDKEIEIGKELARQEGKPEEMLEKIAMGKLNKFFKESTLSEPSLHQGK